MYVTFTIYTLPIGAFNLAVNKHYDMVHFISQDLQFRRRVYVYTIGNEMLFSLYIHISCTRLSLEVVFLILGSNVSVVSG